MAVIPQTTYSNVPAYPKSWYWQNTNWAAKTVSVAADRYKLTSPSAIQVDVGGLSLTNEVAQELDLSLDATWDFGQSTVGTWTAGHSYSVGDWVRATSNGAIIDGANNVSVRDATEYMASNTVSLNNRQIVTESSFYGSYLGYRCFDKTPGFNGYNGYWYTSNLSFPQSVMIDLGLGVCINKYRIQSPFSTDRTGMPRDWKLQGSNTLGCAVGDADNANGWTDLDTRVDIDAPLASAWTTYFTCVNNIAYRYYRIRITDCNANTQWIALGELHLVAAPALLYRCTSPGTSLATEPTWGTTVGGTTAESGGPTWTCYYDDTVASNRAGTDYFLYSCVGSSTVPVLLASRNSTYPHGYDATNSRKIAGFHCLCASVGTIASHPLSGYLTGDILPTTVWDLKKRCRNTGNNNNGMAYIAPLDDWWAIYLASGTATAPVSIYNATILDTIDWNDSVDAGRAVGMRLPRDAEFQVAASLSNEQTNIYGSADPVTTGGHVDTAGRRMISRYGLEDCVGVEYQWLDEQSYRFDAATAHVHAATENAVSGAASVDVAPAWAWYDLPGDKGQLYRQGTYGDVKMLAGGPRDHSSYCGSHYRYLASHRGTVYSAFGFRLVAQNISK